MFYVFVLFLLSEYVYDGGFPFGMNHPVYGTFTDTTDTNQAVINYRKGYKATMDSVAYGLGMGWWRAEFKFRWYDVWPQHEPYDVWDFSDADSLVKWAGERGMHILPVFGYTASWAANQEIPESYWTLYPPDPSYWGEYEVYVESLVERYDGDGYRDFSGMVIPIKHWECINEPYGMYFLGDIDQYIEMFEHSRAGLKRADPGSNIGGPCLSGKPNEKTDMNYPFYRPFEDDKGEILRWVYYDTLSDSLVYDESMTWEQTFSYIVRNIGLDNIDFVTFHMYNSVADFMKLLRELKDTIGYYKPLWITETGFQRADPFRIKTSLYPETSPQGRIPFSPDANGYFHATVYAKYAWSRPCISICDTFLRPGDSVVLIRDHPYRVEKIEYNGGPIRWSDDSIAVNIGDSLHILHFFDREYANTKETQINNYKALFDSLFSYMFEERVDTGFKVFLFCVYPFFIWEVHYHYPLWIQLDSKWLYKTGYMSIYTLIDTLFQPLPAYDTIKVYMSLLNRGLRECDEGGMEGIKRVVGDGTGGLYALPVYGGDAHVLHLPHRSVFIDSDVAKGGELTRLFRFGRHLYITENDQGYGIYYHSTDGVNWETNFIKMGDGNYASGLVGGIDMLKVGDYIEFLYVKRTSKFTLYVSWWDGDRWGCYSCYSSDDTLYNVQFAYKRTPIEEEYYCFEEGGNVYILGYHHTGKFLISEGGGNAKYPYITDSRGKFRVVWVDTLNKRVRYRERGYDSDWKGIEDVAELNVADGRVQPSIGVLSGGRAWVVWADSTDGGWSIYYKERIGDNAWTERRRLNYDWGCEYPFVKEISDSVLGICWVHKGVDGGYYLQGRRVKEDYWRDGVLVTGLSSKLVIIGGNITVYWATDLDVDYTLIYVTRDDGKTWTQVDSLAGSPGSYTWTATYPITDKARFKVEIHGDGVSSDISDRFRIYTKIGPPIEFSSTGGRLLHADVRGLSGKYVWLDGGDSLVAEAGGIRRYGRKLNVRGREVKVIRLWSDEETHVYISEGGYAGISKHLPVYLFDVEYLTGFGMEWPSSVTRVRAGYRDGYDIGDTLEYEFNRVKDHSYVRFYAQGTGRVYVNNRCMGEFGEGENEVFISKGGEKRIRFCGRDIGIGWIGIYSEPGIHGAGEFVNTLPEMRIKEVRTIGSGIRFVYTGPDRGIKIKVIDICGRVIYKKEMDARSGMEVEIKHTFPQGVYFMKVENLKPVRFVILR